MGRNRGGRWTATQGDKSVSQQEMSAKVYWMFAAAMLTISAAGMAAVIWIAVQNERAAAEKNKDVREARQIEAAQAFPKAAEDAQAAVENAKVATKEAAQAMAKLETAKAAAETAAVAVEQAERDLAEALREEMIAKTREVRAFRHADWVRQTGQVEEATAYDALREEAEADAKMQAAETEARWLGAGMLAVAILVFITICGALSRRRW